MVKFLLAHHIVMSVTQNEFEIESVLNCVVPCLWIGLVFCCYTLLGRTWVCLGYYFGNHPGWRTMNKGVTLVAVACD